MWQIPFAAAAAFTLFFASWALVPQGEASVASPAVYSVFEGVDEVSGSPALVVAGEALTEVASYELLDGAGNVLGAPELLLRTPAVVVVGLPSSLPQNQYALRVCYGNTTPVQRTLRFSLSAGERPSPARCTEPSLLSCSPSANASMQGRPQASCAAIDESTFSPEQYRE